MTAKYDRQELIGSGTFGNVYLVRSKTSDQQYVLKEINLKNMSGSEKHLALTEVTVLARCRHKNIIRYKEAMIEQESGILSIVMEYAEHGDMYAAIKKRKGVYFPETDVLSWFIQITLALQYIHNHNILHRDLKTQNIFLTGDKMVKVGDFGIARVLKEDNELAMTAIGTPYYLSPEICQRRPYNCKSDVWALGCILFEITALVHPFQGQNFHQLVSSILKVQYREFPSHCSALIQDLVKILLHLDPDKRPSTDEILAIPALQSHLYRYLNIFSTPESLGVIDSIAVAALKKNNTRRFSSNDVLDTPRPSPSLKRTVSVSAVTKSITKIQKRSVLSGTNEPSRIPKPLSSIYRQSKKRSVPYEPSPLADIKNNQKTKAKKSISTGHDASEVQPALKDSSSMKQTYSIWRKAVEKGEKAFGIGNKRLKDSNGSNQRAGTDIDVGYQSGEASSQTISEAPSGVKTTKRPWSMSFVQKQSKGCHTADKPQEKMVDMLNGATLEYIDDVFDVKQDTETLHCPHSSQCQCCILDILWKNRIKSTGDVDGKERSRLRRTLQAVLGKMEFEDLYQALFKAWNDVDRDFSLHSLIQKLNFEQRQHIPLLMQLLQMDFVNKSPFVS